MTEVAYYVLGTCAMVFMMGAIILFVYIFQKKLVKKEKEFSEIENLMQKQELQSAYSLMEGQELERKRIAAELHDNIGGILVTLKIYSDLVLQKDKIEDIKGLNTKISDLCRSLSQEVRKLSHELDLRSLSGFGLKTSVQQLAEAIMESGKLKVNSFIDVQRPLNEVVAINLYKIIQELFTNTLKHANASEVQIEIANINNYISLIYEDNGKGFNLAGVNEVGLGLKNIKARVSKINGKINMESSDKGTTIIVEIGEHG